mgnify:CR=1 FL=1
MTEYLLLGLDGEMTGGTKTLDFYKEFQLCQIGLALGFNKEDVYTSDIGFDANEYKWTQEALDVNKFTHERIVSGPRQWQVDSELVAWLRARSIVEDGSKLVAVGFNVASWDLPFVRYYLPRFSKSLSYRTVDLNAVLFAAEQVTGLSYNSIKDHAKRYAKKVLAKTGAYPVAMPHDAGYDAAASLAAFEYLVKLLTPKVSWKVDEP